MVRSSTVALAAVASLLVGVAAAGAEEVIARGTFEGASGHETMGSVSVQRSDAGTLVVLGPDFSLDSAPDPKLGFGSDGRYDPASQFSPLNANRGEQSYPLAGDIDPTRYNEFYVWCEKFSVPLGVAKLN